MEQEWTTAGQKYCWNVGQMDEKNLEDLWTAVLTFSRRTTL